MVVSESDIKCQTISITVFEMVWSRTQKTTQSIWSKRSLVKKQYIICYYLMAVSDIRCQTTSFSLLSSQVFWDGSQVDISWHFNRDGFPKQPLPVFNASHPSPLLLYRMTFPSHEKSVAQPPNFRCWKSLETISYYCCWKSLESIS